MSVIGINGSHRMAGNASKFVQAVLEGATDAGAATKLFQIGEMRISNSYGFCR